MPTRLRSDLALAFKILFGVVHCINESDKLFTLRNQPQIHSHNLWTKMQQPS